VRKAEILLINFLFNKAVNESERALNRVNETLASCICISTLKVTLISLDIPS
jgi:hypothetical protein